METETMERTESGASSESELAPSAPGHAHHWVIDEAAGPQSHGVCRECHEERDFRNWLTETDFVTRGERLYAA